MQNRKLTSTHRCALRAFTLAVALTTNAWVPALAQSQPASAAVAAPRFATDAAVREGMLAVRAAMQAQVAAIAADTLDARAYTALGNTLQTVLDGTLARRSLPKAASVAFRGSIWQDLDYCVGLLRNGRSVAMQRTGALGVQQVLRNYPQYFEHPGW